MPAHLRNMTALDAPGIHGLERLAHSLRDAGKSLLLCGARDQPARLLSNSDFLKQLGPRTCSLTSRALIRAKQIQADFSGVGREIAAETKNRPL